MYLDITLKQLPSLQLDDTILSKPTRILHKIIEINNQRFEQGYESKNFKNRKKELIVKLKKRKTRGESFEKASDVVGRQRLLLSLYIEHYGHSDSKWLPSFDEKVAFSILGKDGTGYHIGRRRQVAVLFFTHFDLLTAITIVCSRLIESFSTDKAGESSDKRIRIWHQHRRLLFTANGPANIANQAIESENLTTLIKRFEIPKQGRFAERLRQIFLLNKIKSVRIGQEAPAFAEVENLREEQASANLLMGAAALQVLIQRITRENNGKWTGSWPKWITRFGCDPRYGRRTAGGAKWWGWATDSELRLAMQGITGQTLSFFIKFLENSLKGTSRESQFDLRARFLMSLFESQKIVTARLALNWSDYRRLNPKYRDPMSVSKLSSTTAQTSMICLQCIDDVFIVEGTHTFGLRAFHREFPIRGFWKLPRSTYQDSEFRLSPVYCPIFIRHVKSGTWVGKFYSEIRSKFHVEWTNTIR